LSHLRETRLLPTAVFQTLGPDGVVHQVLSVDTAGPMMVLIHVLEIGEETLFPISRIVEDPQAV